VQILPIIVVLGGVSWMVCAVSLQGETGHKELWPTRLGDAAHRVTLGIGTALRTRGPAARTTARVRAVLALRRVAFVLAEVARGLPAAARSVREGVGEDAAAIREWVDQGRDRLSPVILRILALCRTAVRTAGPPVSRLVHAARPQPRSRSAGFAETLSVTWAETEAVQPLDLPAEEDAEEDEHHLRGVLGLILLIAVIGFLIAAGLMSVAWGIKHLIVLRRTA